MMRFWVDNFTKIMQVEEAMKLEDDEEDDKMIERIRKQRARLVATLPSADRQLQVVALRRGASLWRGGL